MKFVASLLLVCASCIAAVGADAAAETGASAFLWHPDGAAPVAGDDAGATAHRDDDWFRSDFEIRRDWIGTAWRSDGAVFADDHLALRLAPVTDGTTDKDFLGAEVQSPGFHSFGRYEVVMRPARAHGVISSFFTYTGPHFDAPHDEIDIEFLGKDTTRMWVLAFSDGKKLQGEFLELGFDAADAPHLYAFEWTPDDIKWFVDGTEVFQVQSQTPPVPHNPGKIYMNIWAGGPGQRGWSGVAPADTQAEAQYYCVSFRPTGTDASQCSDTYTGD